MIIIVKQDSVYDNRNGAYGGGDDHYDGDDDGDDHDDGDCNCDDQLVMVIDDGDCNDYDYGDIKRF